MNTLWPLQVNVSDTAVGFSESREDTAFKSPRSNKSQNLIPLPIPSVLYITHQAAASRKPSFSLSDGAKLPCGQTFSNAGDDSETVHPIVRGVPTCLSAS